MKLLLLRALTPALLLLACAGPAAEAAITASEITSSNIQKFDYIDSLDVANPAYSRTVSGTATGDAGDEITVGCWVGSSRDKTFGSAPLGADGTWSVTARTFSANEKPCVLRAVPTDAAPADLTPFKAGGTIYPGSFYVERNSTTQKAYDWGISGEPRESGWADYYSLGNCGLCDMLWRDASTGQRSTVLWYENASTGGTYSYDADGAGVGAPPVTLSQTTVDGVRAYAPDNIGNTSSEAFIGLSFTRSVDPVTGASTTKSTEALMTCPTGDCTASIGDTGIRVERTTLYDHDGQVFRIDDVVRNVSGSSHDVDLGFANWTQGNHGLRLPGESAFSARTNQRVTPAPAPVYTAAAKNVNANPVDPLNNPVGTLTTAPSPDVVEFTTNSRLFQLRWKFTLAAGATKTITQIYTMGGTLAATEALGAEAEDRLIAPTVGIDSPADGATVDKDTVAVSGTAADNGTGLTVTVNGKDAAVSGGKWSTTVALKAGENTITATARDATGNALSASRKVKYVPAKTAAPTQTKPPVPPVQQPVPPAQQPVPLGAMPGPPRFTTIGKPLVRGGASGSAAFTVSTDMIVTCPAGGPVCTADVAAVGALPVARDAGKPKRRTKRTTIGRSKLTIPAGEAARVSFKLSPAATRALRAAGSMRVTVTVVTRAGAGAPQTTAKTITIKAPVAKKKKRARRG